MPPATRSGRSLALCARILAALPAGFTLVSLVVATLGGLLAWVGMPRSEAVALATMSGFVIYLCWLLWAFAARSVISLYAPAGLTAMTCWAVLLMLPKA